MYWFLLIFRNKRTSNSWFLNLFKEPNFFMKEPAKNWRFRVRSLTWIFDFLWPWLRVQIGPMILENHWTRAASSLVFSFRNYPIVVYFMCWSSRTTWLNIFYHVWIRNLIESIQGPIDCFQHALQMWKYIANLINKSKSCKCS